MSAPQIRPAAPEDAQALAALSIEVWLGTYIKSGVSDTFARYALTAFTPDILHAQITDPRQRLLVSCNRDGPEAYIRITDASPCPSEPGCTTEIATLYVQPRHHGRGVGSRLLAAGLALCTGPVWVATNAENAPAIGFYRARGFVTEGETAFTLGGEAYPNIVLLLDPSRS